MKAASSGLTRQLILWHVQLFVYKTPFALLRPNYSIFEKIYLGQNVLHPKPVIWYLYIFFIHQLFVYFFAPDVPIGHHKDFLNLVFFKCQFFGKDTRHGSEFPVFENFHHHKMWLFYSRFSATFKTN